jgi:glyoxylase-like metal-dependent hydrolase (beta-lactamase superfamily II)
VKLILPQITFDKSITLWLGGREVRLMYLRPGQQDGDTFVYFPHAHVLFTGLIRDRNIANMAFTTSVDSWINLLDRVAAMDAADRILPAYGDLATPRRRERIRFHAARGIHDRKVRRGQGRKSTGSAATLTFPQYKNWRNYGRIRTRLARSTI